VVVHDLLTERWYQQWAPSVSSYAKLRLAPEWLAAEIEKRGLRARRETAPAGMVRMVGSKTGEAL
jgi:hypothetical protein